MVSKLTFDVLVNFPLENETSTKCIMIICWDGIWKNKVLDALYLFPVVGNNSDCL